MPVEAFVYGGASAVLAELVSFPFDTSKIRLQVQGQVTDESLTATKYRGTLHALRLLTVEEGLRAPFNGVKFAALRQATYGTLRFGIFFSGKSWWKSKGGTDKNLPFFVALGTSAGVISSIVTTPIDRMKVLSQSTAQTKKMTILKTTQKIYNKGGLSGLYQGKFANAKRAGVVNGVEIPCYVFVKDYCIESLKWPDNFRTQFTCALITSAVGIAFSQPFDVAKTRIMQQKRHRTDIRVYKGFFDMMKITVMNEGVAALWKGSYPAWVRNAPWNITFYICLESFRKFDMYLNNREEAVF